MAKAHHGGKSVTATLAASNRWLIGMLLVLVGIVFVVLYNYSTYQSVKGIATKAAELKNTASIGANDDRLSNGCFVLKGNVAVLNPCGKGLYRQVKYTCGDNSQGSGITAQSGANPRVSITPTPTACKSIAAWLSSVASYCTGHTSCDAKSTPTPKVSATPTPAFYCKPSDGFTCPSGYSCKLYNDSNPKHKGYGYCVLASQTPETTVTPATHQ